MLDEAQLAEQEALRKQLQQEQDLLQQFQEKQEAKLLDQHDKEKRLLDEKVENSKRELERQVRGPIQCLFRYNHMCDNLSFRPLMRALTFRIFV